MVKILKHDLYVLLLLVSRVGICATFSVRPTIKIISQRHDIYTPPQQYGIDSLRQHHTMTSKLRDPTIRSSTNLFSITGSDLNDAILAATAFAGIAVYTYRNPDTSDKIRESIDGTKESSKVVVKTTPIPSPTTVDIAPAVTVTPTKPVVAVVTTTPPTVPKSKEQEQLSTLLQTVSKTVEEQSVKLEELESKMIETNTPATPKGGKIKFVLKVVKKAVMPWKAWASL